MPGSEKTEQRIIPPEKKFTREVGQSWSGFSFYILCAVCFVDGADKALLPASFRAMEVSMLTSPKDLAVLSLVQGVALAVSGPIWGNLADSGFSRKSLLVAGVMGWSAVTVLLAFSDNFGIFIALRILNGCALGMLLPVVQSLIADCSSIAQNDLGFRFGFVEMCSLFGQVVAIIAVTSVAEKQIMGHEGWRVAYLSVAFLSFAIAAFVHVGFVEAPRTFEPENFGLQREFSKFVKYFKIPSFRVIVLQGMFGTIPGQALTFMVMYFQYVGLSDFTASALVGVGLTGAGVGSLLGGTVGDKLASFSETHGRPLTAQISVTLGIPVVLAIFMLPIQARYAHLYAALSFCLGLGSSWAGPGCNKPVFARIVPSHSRGSAFAWSIALEASSGSIIGPLLVGQLAQRWFGYETNQKPVGEMSTAERLENASALGNALILATVIPWSICLLLYTRLHFTYARDLEELSPLLPGLENEQRRDD
jgi:MFS family permease